ncbi:FHA domain-containing protein [Plantactinospora sp. GCM10030261]|uniref:FHA domain-containing protein n=1 Tax=Plantactinospora sp. GCM10030261 TaxID=3273420 RepID=UPI00360FB7CD
MRVEDHLTLDIEAVDFAVDMSNVVRNRALPGDRPADLRRFLGLVRAVVRYTRDESAQVYAVADASLLSLRELTNQERTTLHRWRDAGLIQVRDVADDRLLELADLAGVPVISDDRFLDAYRTYPWIAGSRDRFFRATAAPDEGGVRLEPRTMSIPPDWQISRKEEESRLLAVGMYDRRHGTGARAQLLTRRWRCPEDDCPIFGADAPANQPPPVFRQGTVRCPTHQRPLTDVGPRPAQKQFKLRVDGVVKARFMLVAGTPSVVGRAPTGPGLALAREWLDERAHGRISREHVELAWDGTRISIRDLSRNGTWVRRDQGADAGRRLPSGGRSPKDRSAWTLRAGEVIVLCDGVELVASGRTFVFDTEETTVPAQPDALAVEAAQATMIERPPRRR